MIKVRVIPHGTQLVSLTGPVCKPFWIDTKAGLDRLRALIFSRYPELLPLESDLDLNVAGTRRPDTPAFLCDGDEIDMFLKYQTV